MLTIVSSNAPTVGITAPTAGQTIYSGTPLALAATATPNQGAIASFQFLDGTTLIGTAAQSGSTFTLAWPNPTQGSHTIVAKATDAYGESATSSQAVTVLAGTPGTGIYYVYADQIDAPRMIVRAADNQAVWQWNIADPFGAAAPNTNPSGLGQFTYNPRLPGQLSDLETGVFYNINRSCDPTLGRYVQSDVLGLMGGVNTYLYAGGNSLSWLDPFGTLCLSKRQIDGIAGAAGNGLAGLVAGSELGIPGAIAGAVVGAYSGYVQGTTGYEDPGDAAKTGGLAGAGSGLDAPAANLVGGAVGGLAGYVTNDVTGNENLAGAVGGVTGGAYGGAIDSWVKTGVVGGKATLRGGLLGLLGAGTTIGTTWLLNQLNDCPCQR